METRIGTILLENPLIRKQDLEACLDLQELGGRRKRIGQILVEEGIISRETLSKLLEVQRKRRVHAKRRVVGGAAMFRDNQVPPIGDLVMRARSMEATDLFLGHGRKPWARVAGKKEEVSNVCLDEAWIRRFLYSFLTPDQKEQLGRSGYIVANLRQGTMSACRAMVFSDSLGTAVVVRLHQTAPPSIEKLGLSDCVADMLRQRKGIVVVAGGVGSGKSTTIAAMVNSIARSTKGHIIVLEENHEFAFPDSECLITYRRVGTDSETMETAIRAAMQEDPDIIVVGNLDDSAAIEMATQAASTGTMILAGVRSSGCVAGIKSLCERVPDQRAFDFRVSLADVLAGIIYLELVPPSSGRRMELVHEVMPRTRELRRALIQGDFDRIHEIIARHPRATTFDASLARLVDGGKVSVDEAFARARDGALLLRTMGVDKEIKC